MAGLQKILLIEDDFMIRDLYGMTFSGAGYPTQTANDAVEAYKKLENFTPDIVFIDIMLPGKSGIEILKDLRTNPKYKCQTAKIIMLTNLAQEDLEAQAKANKANGYLIKVETVPSDLIKIVERISKSSPK